MSKRNDPHSRRRFEQRISADADQTEITAFRNGTEMLDGGIRDDRLAGAMDDFSAQSPSGMPHWQEVDLELETATSEVTEEIIRRSVILADAYPFRIRQSRLYYEPKENLIYEYCLAITQAKSLTVGEFVELPRTFERVVSRICAGLLGNQVEVVHTGAPRDGNPQPSFKQIMERVNSLSGEWIWSPRPGLPTDGPTTGDEGLDFVAWRSAPDKRTVGQLFMVGQCACGDDWEGKWADLSCSKLKKWFNPFPYVPPIRSFATPFVLSNGFLHAASEEAGIVFDRIRLAALVADPTLSFDLSMWEGPMQQCIELVVDNQS